MMSVANQFQSIMYVGYAVEKYAMDVQKYTIESVIVTKVIETNDNE